MIDSILKSTRGKLCTCPSGKICTHCKAKRIEQPKAVVNSTIIPIETITYYKSGENIYKQKPTIQYLEKPKRWRLRKRQKYEPPPQPKSTAICRWYKRRKALKQLIREHEKEKELSRKRKHDEYERERMIELLNWEKAKKERSSSVPLPPVQTFKWERKAKRQQSLPPPRKLVYIKEKSATVKPRAHSKHVSAKQYDPRDSITKRFVNYCYRFCCQLYCYITCIILIIFTFFFIL